MVRVRPRLVCTLISGICLIWFMTFVLNENVDYQQSNHGNWIRDFSIFERAKDLKHALYLSDREIHHGNPCVPAANFNQSQSYKCISETQPKLFAGFSTGRLGNQMFFYSTVIGIAQCSNRSAYMSPITSGYISKYFDVPTKTIDATLVQQIKWRQVDVNKRNVWEPRFKRELRAPYVNLTAFLQLRKYFDNIRPTIRQHFKFYDDITQRSQYKLKHAKNEFYGKGYPTRNVTMVGVHVRRGDYPDYEEEWRFSMPTVEFYKGAMKYFHERYEYVIFVVSTNENDTWCKTNFVDLNNEFQIHYLDGALEEDGGLDMAVLTECDHLIFGIGTFGWWAGYLGHGEVVYCSDCVWPDSPMLRMWEGDYANFVLPDWIGYSISGTKKDV